MQLEITNINTDGDGYGFLNNKKVFISKTLPGDFVEFNIEKENKDYIVGRLNKIIKFSANRVNSIPCPFYEKCGGCNLLHLNDYDYYDFKMNIIKKAIKESEFELKNVEVIKIPYNTRRRVTFKVKNNKLGFFEKNSNELVEINNCLLITKEINDAIDNLKILIKKFSCITEISVTSHENGLELLLTFKQDISINENKILKEFIENDKNIITLSYKLNEQEPFLFYQREIPTLTFDNISPIGKTNKIKLELFSNIFLQATQKGQEYIIDTVLEELKGCKNILDLYCGIGTYSFPLSLYTKVHSVEGNQNMINILNRNVKNNNLNNKITTEYRNLVFSPILKDELNKYDGVIINPPRNGAKAQIEIISKSNIKKVVMVSCNPRTFSIDANELRNNNYNLIRIVGIDQFYRTPHLEIIGVFEK